MLDQDKKPILLFELGHLQVFCYQTIIEWSSGIAPKEIFWQKKGDPKIRGPFQSIYHAVQDYSEYIQAVKDVVTGLPDNVVHVDFKNKRRLT